MKGRLKNIADVKRFAFAGNSTFTLRNKQTKERYTFKVIRNKGNTDIAYLVKVMFGKDNEKDFRPLGHLVPSMAGYRYIHGQYPRTAAYIDTDERSLAIRWFFAMIEAGKFRRNFEIWHEGRCGHCGRKLTVPESIEDGIGPECRKHFASELDEAS